MENKTMKNNFAKGIYFKLPPVNAPEWVKMNLSIKKDEFIQFLTSLPDDIIRLDVKISKDGKLYSQVNEWKANNSKNKSYENDDLPF